MTKSEALQKLESIQNDGDTEALLFKANKILLDLIKDPEVTKAYEDIFKWCP